MQEEGKREGCEKHDMGKRRKIWKKTGFVWRFLIKTAAIAVGIFILITFIFAVHRATGNTMSPFVRDGDLCVFYRLEKSQLGDVVLYKTEDGKEQIGRIVAIPGQEVNFPEEGGYTIDDYQPTEEIPYETYAAEDSEVQFPLDLGEDEYFIMNDLLIYTEN